MTTLDQPRPVPDLTAPRTPPPLTVDTSTLDTGLEVLAVERGGAPLVELRLTVPFAGSGEPAAVARTSLLGETMLSGTERHTNAELAAALQSLGGALRVRVDADRLLITGESLAHRLPELLDLLGEVLTAATYPAREVAGERSRMIEEVRIARSQPSVLAREALLQRLFGAHPYGREVPEPEELDGTTDTDVRALHAERVLPAGSALVLVGDVPTVEAVDASARALAAWAAPGSTPPAPAMPALEHGPVVLVNRPGSVQSSVRFGGHALPRTDPGYAALQLANTIFGGYFSSRLVENIREDKGYTYSPHCVIRHARAGSTVQLDADVASEVTAPALLEIGYELGRIATLPVATEELENARQYAIGTLALQTATQSGLADMIVALDASGLDAEWLREHPARLAAVTVEQTLEQAARFLAPSRLVAVVLGDADRVEPSMRTLGDVARG